MRIILVGLILSLCCACAPHNDPKPGSTVHAGPPATTATDQRNNEADLKLVQRVRQALTDDDTLSVAAKNVTAVARDGAVTLNGAVASQVEKDQVEADVSRVEGVRRVDNQLTVKPN